MKRIQIIFCALCVQAPLTAALFDSYGSDPESQSMAGAGIAFADHWSAAFRNPAGLASPKAQNMSKHPEKKENAKGKFRLTSEKGDLLEDATCIYPPPHCRLPGNGDS